MLRFINMAKELTKEEVQHVAQLAQLGLSDEETEGFRKQLSAILEFVSELQELDTKDREPLSQTTGLKNVFRADEIRPSLTQEEALANAKEVYKGYFKVKATFFQ